MSGILIDVPVVAYKTWCITIYDENGNRLYDIEKVLKEDLYRAGYRYAPDHKHTR